MKKEDIIIIAASLVSLGLLWTIKTEVAVLRETAKANSESIAELRETAKANSESIAELRADVNEIRGVVNANPSKSALEITCKIIDTACKVIGVK